MKKSLRLVLFVSLTCLFGTASAVDKIWITDSSNPADDPSGREWSDPYNWNNYTAPVDSLFTQRIVFNQAQGGYVLTNVTQSVNGLLFSYTAGAYNIGGPGANATLSLGSGGIINASASDQMINGSGFHLALGDNSRMINDGSGMLQVGAASLNLNSHTLSLQGAGTGFSAIYSPISGSGGIVVESENTWFLVGANSYTGGTTINSGTLAFGNSNVLGSGPLTLNGGVLDLAENHFESVSAVTLVNGTITGTGTSTLGSGTGFAVQNGVIDVALNGVGGLTKTGSGTVTLNHANNYVGTTTVSGGTLVSGASNALGNGALTITNGSTLDLGLNHVDTVGTVTLVSGSINGTGASRLTSTGSFELQSGVVNVELAGAAGINKTTAGTVTLNHGSGFTGPTNVSGGVLKYGTSFVLGNGAVTVETGGTLDMGTGHFDTVGTVTLAGGSIAGAPNSILTSVGTFEMQSGTVSVSLAGVGIALNKTTGGTVTLSAANTYNGLTTISAGTLALNGSNLLAGGAVTVNGGILDLGLNHFDTLGTVTLANGKITGTGTSWLSSTGSFEMQNGTVDLRLLGPSALNKTTAGTVILAGDNNYGGLTTITGGTLQLGNGGLTGSVGGAILNNASLVFNRSTSSSFQDGVISGSGTVTKQGAGALILRSDNTYAGLTTIASGSLYVGWGGTTGSVAGDIANSGHLFFSRSDDTTYGGVISGTGTVNKTNPNTLTLTGANTYTGATTVHGGTLVLANTTKSPAFVIDAGSTLELAVASGLRDHPSGTTTFSGAGTLRKSGDGTVKWSKGTAVFALGAGSLIDVEGGEFVGGSFGNENWTNNKSQLNVGAGAKFVGGEANVRVDALTGTGLITSGYDAGAGYQQFTFGVANGSGTFGGVLGNDLNGSAGNYRKEGTGTQILTGASTYTGTTTVAGGALIVNGSLGNTAVTVNSGATLGGHGSIGGLTTVQDSAHLAAGNSPGTLTFTNGLTLQRGAILDFELGAEKDLFRITSGVLGGPEGFGGLTLNFFDVGGFDPLLGGTFMLFDFTGATLDGFDVDDFAFGALLAGTTRSDYAFFFQDSTLQLSYRGGGEQPSAPPRSSTVPDESATLGLFAAALFGLVVLQRKAGRPAMFRF